MEALFQQLPVEGGDLSQPETIGSGVVTTHISGSRAEFQDLLAKEGAHHLCLPCGITGEILHPDQGLITDVPLPSPIGDGAAEHGPDGGESILPADLLPFLVAPAMVGDGDLVD